jgi:hypothetical protein
LKVGGRRGACSVADMTQIPFIVDASAPSGS